MPVVNLLKLLANDIDDLDAILKEVELQTKQAETKQAGKKKGKGNTKFLSRLIIHSAL